MGKTAIHELRCKLAQQRQPDHEGDLAQLRAAVPPSDHPYRDSVSPGCFRRLLELPGFKWPSKGPRARLPDGKFLFHLRTLEGFLSEIQITSDPRRPFPPGSDPTINLDKVRDRIALIAARLHQPWVPLELIAEGAYCIEPSPGRGKRRLITWWTDLSVHPDRTLQHAHRLGIPKNWLNANCVVLRCRVDHKIRIQAHVPSVLDGFASEIFLAKIYSDDPTSGQSIDIGSSSFDLGEAEFVLGPIEVTKIEVRLVEISRTQISASAADTEDPAFLERLEKYYRSQLI